MTFESETRRRRTFAIISHPDAGKTTLTEKLLLFSGAIQIAGSVKARKASRHATSDWMEIEKQRGISVASSVMQMLYRDHVINLLDTPGHKDFSEDTYRVLTAVDSALMVIDAANGVEAQTRRLIEVCRQRDTPIITFVNKMDREVRDPLDILDEVERELGMPCCPITWPVGQGKSFGGIINLRTQTMTVFTPGSDRGPKDFEVVPLAEADRLRARFGQSFDDALESMELAVGASAEWNHADFLAGKLTPVFFGSGVNNFGVMEVLDAALVAWPPPGLETDTPVERTPVFQESLLLALPAHHPPVQSPADLQLHTLAAFTRGCTYRHIGEAWMQGARGTAPHVLELASYHAIIACVAAGRCAGVVPQAVWDLMREPPPLRLVPLQTCDTVLVRRRGYQSPALDALLAALQGTEQPTAAWISSP